MQHNHKKAVFFIFYFLLFTFYIGCMPAPYYQKEEYIPQNSWAYSYKPSFSFDITDTNAAYLPYFLIRHTQAYPYCNIWVLLNIKTPGDPVIKQQRIDVTLTESSGKWLGRGMGEIYEQRLPVSFDSIRFNKVGTYTITMEQNMRINPLPEVMNVGLRIDKVGVHAQ
jgi:gliding motility-associated lipoprotein GldH